MRHSYAAFSMAWQKHDPNAIALYEGTIAAVFIVNNIIENRTTTKQKADTF